MNPHEYPSLRIMDPEHGTDNLLVRRNMGFTASWSPDGKRLAFSQLEVYRNYSEYSDLFLYDLSNKAIQRLTHGARLRDPDFNPDGNRLICVENSLGKNRLVIVDLTGHQDILDWMGADLILSHPRWSPDGRFVAVSVWIEGTQGIYLLDMEREKIFPVLIDKVQELTPTWSPDGKYLLFSSDRTGVYNLFSYRIDTAELHQITNVLGGAFTPDVAPGGQEIVFSSYSSRGFDLHRTTWAPENWKKIETPLPDLTEKPKIVDASKPVHQEPYSAWPTVRPRFWTPILGSDESGLQTGAATGGMDILGKHKFDAVALFGTETRRPAYSLQYVNDSFYSSLHVGFSDFAVLHTDLLDIPSTDNNYWERQRRVDLDITLPRLSFQTQQSLLLRYRAEWLSALSDVPPWVARPEEGRLSGFRLSWQMGTAREFCFSIGREDGRRLLASYTRFDHRLGSDFDQNRYIASWHEYQELFLRHHALAVRLIGAVATGDRLTQRAFQVGGPTLTEEFVDPDQNEFFLRGYPSRLLRGQKVALGTLEYRIPLLNIERGVRTWPFFFRRVHAALFYDLGNAWDDNTTLAEFRRGVGIEVKMDMIFGHQLPLRLRWGFAEGLDQAGEQQAYFTAGNSF